MNIAGAIHHLSLPCLLLTHREWALLPRMTVICGACIKETHCLPTLHDCACIYSLCINRSVYCRWLEVVHIKFGPQGDLYLATCNLPFTSKIIKKNWSRAFKMWRLQRAIKTPAEFPFLHPLLPLDANQRGSCWLSGRADLIWDRNAVS